MLPNVPSVVIRPVLAIVLGVAVLTSAEDAALVEVKALLADQRAETNARAAITGRARAAEPPTRAAILAAVADARPAWAGNFAGENLDDASPQVRAAAISVLARTWPSTLDNLERIRRMLGDPNPGVSEAAAGFVARVRDDGALSTLVDRLEGDTTGTMRRTLIALAGPDAGSATAWRDRLQDMSSRLGGVVEVLRTAMAKNDADGTRAAIQQLLSFRNQKVSVGLLLRDLAEGKDPAVARLAREGLTTLGGPVADCLPPPGATTPVGSAKALQVAPVIPEPPRPPLVDPAGLIVGLIILGILGGIAWMLWQVKPIQAATRRIARIASERLTLAVVKPTRRITRRLKVAISRPTGRHMKALTARISKPKPKPKPPT